MKKIVLIIVILFAVILSVVLFFKIKETKKKNVKLQWNENEKLTYSLKFNSTANLAGNLMPGFTAGKELNIVYDCNLIVKILETKDDFVWLQIFVDNMNMKQNSESITKDFYKKPFLIKLLKNGKIEKFIFYKLLEKKDINILKSIAYSFQFTVKSNQQKWSSIENNELGTYSVYYYIDKNSEIIGKTIKYNSLVDNALYKDAVVKIDESEKKIKLNSNGSWFDKIVTKEKLDLYKNRKAIVKTKVNIEINRIKNNLKKDFFDKNFSVEDLKKQLALLNKDNKTNESEIENILENNAKKVDKTNEEIVNSIKSQNKNINDLLSLYLSKLYSAENVSKLELKQIFDVMVAYLKENPSEVWKVIDLIQSKKLPDKRSGKLFLLLEKVGHQEAQNALMKMLDQPELFSRLSSLRASVALLGIKNITMSTVSRMMTIEQAESIPYKDARNTLLLTIGAIAQNAVNPDVKTQCINYIKTKMNAIDKNTEITDMLPVIDAAGNTQESEFVNEFESYITDEQQSEVVKKTAIKALMHMPPEKTDPVFVKVIKTGDNELINMTAETLTKRNAFNQTNKLSDDLNEVLKDEYEKVKDLKTKLLVTKSMLIDKSNYDYLRQQAEEDDANWQIKKAIFDKIPMKADKYKQHPGPDLKVPFRK